MPAIEVEFHPEARQEYLEALAWHIERSETVGRRFQQETAHAVQLISGGPERWPLFEGNIRWIRLHRFPFLLYYRPIASERIQILAVAHGRQRPGYWRHRQHS